MSEEISTLELDGNEAKEMDEKYMMLFGIYFERNNKKLDKVIMKTKKFIMTIERNSND